MKTNTKGFAHIAIAVALNARRVNVSTLRATSNSFVSCFVSIEESFARTISMSNTRREANWGVWDEEPNDVAEKTCAHKANKIKWKKAFKKSKQKHNKTEK